MGRDVRHVQTTHMVKPCVMKEYVILNVMLNITGAIPLDVLTAITRKHVGVDVLRVLQIRMVRPFASKVSVRWTATLDTRFAGHRVLTSIGTMIIAVGVPIRVHIQKVFGNAPPGVAVMQCVM